MTLTFPTIAEQVLAEFNNSTRTISLATIARRRGATITTSNFSKIKTYTFDDDTSITASGRGRAHKIEAHLP